MGEGEERENLEALAEELKISNNVIFTGKLPHSELVGILSKAKAMLVYTESDLNMLSIVESLAMATPVVTYLCALQLPLYKEIQIRNCR